MTEREIGQFVSDSVMEIPYGFSVDDDVFYLYPASLGKTLLIQRYIDELNIDVSLIKDNAIVELLRVVKEKRESCIKLITYYTCKNKEEVCSQRFIEERINRLTALDDDDVATILYHILTQDVFSLVSSHLGIEKEQYRLSKAMAVKRKNSKNELIFGGKTIYGTLIDIACERYGWTMDYVVWGISYMNLRLLLADRINSIYVTDEEMKDMPADVRNSNEKTIVADKENMEQILSMDWH